MWVYFQGILNSRLCIQGVVCRKRVMPRPSSGYPFFYLCQGNLVYISCFDFSHFSLSVPSYLFWYRCSNATFLLISKLCQVWVVKYTNSLNAKLQKQWSDCLHFLPSFSSGSIEILWNNGKNDSSTLPCSQ